MTHKIATLAIIIVLLAITLNYFKSAKQQTAVLTGPELVEKYGYPIESHEVITEDGYILTLHRIPHGKTSTTKKRQPIFLMHGFAHSSFNYLQFGPNVSLSYLLAEKGFDVWLGNARGNTWGRNHKYLNPDKDPQFWNFTVHEIGTYDLPASIEYVLKVTKYEQLYYVGFSQGTTSFYIMGSQRPEYLQKIKYMTALAPAAFMLDTESAVIQTLSSNWEPIESFFKFFRIFELGSRNTILSAYFDWICDENSYFSDLCIKQIFMVFGYNPGSFDKSILTVEFSQTPAGVSIMQMVHFFQMFEKGTFCQYDLRENNLVRYGQHQAPCYELSNINIPMAIYYSRNDWVVSMTAVNKLKKIFPNIVKTYEVPLPTFNHYDFLFNRNVVTLLYNIVIEDIVKYQ